MIYVTSDLHGKFQCLITLLNQAEFFMNENNHLYILGDVIDRNENGGIDILQWIRKQHNVTLLLGNHEQMMLDCRWLFDGTNQVYPDSRAIRALDLWKHNGGSTTIAALKRESFEVRQELLDYLESCPLYKTLMLGTKSYVLVHGGLGRSSPARELSTYTEEELLWERPYLTTVYSPEKFTVILGHTPTELYRKESKGRMLKTTGWWNIDTGAAAATGTPMLLCLDTRREYYLNGDEE